MEETGDGANPRKLAKANRGEATCTAATTCGIAPVVVARSSTGRPLAGGSFASAATICPRAAPLTALRGVIEVLLFNRELGSQVRP